MKIRISTIYKLILYSALLGQVLFYVFLPMRMSRLVSLGVTIITLTNLLALALILSDKKRDARLSNGAIRILTLVFFAMLSLFFSSSLNLAAIKKLVVFLQMPVYFIVARRIGKNTVRELIYGVNLCYPIVFGLYSKAGFSHRYVGEYGETIHKNLTLGYNNPNEAGMYLMLCLIVLVSAIFHYKTKKMKVFCVLEVGFVGYLLVRTNCRIAISIATAVFLLTMLCKRIHISETTWGIVLLFPAVYVLLLCLFPILLELEYLGEAVDTGRRSLYLALLQSITFQKFCFGDFSRYALTNMHNAYLSIFASFGIFSVWSFLNLLYTTISRCCDNVIRKKENITLQLGVVAVIIHSSVESALLVNGSIYAASVFLLFYLFVSNDEILPESVS